MTLYFEDLSLSEVRERTQFQDSTALVNFLKLLLIYRSPFFAEITSQSSSKLLIGVGEIGCAQHSEKDGRPPYCVAVYRNAPAEAQEMTFLTGGEATPIVLRFTMPFDIIELIIEYFESTGGMNPIVSWEEI
jgi:hypothetical protein